MFPEHSASSLYVPSVVPPAHAVPMHTGVPDVPADPSGSADAPGPIDPCIGRIPPSLGRLSCALPGGSPVPETASDLQHIVADPAEAAAICEYGRLSTQFDKLTSVIYSGLSTKSRPGGPPPDIRVACEEASKQQNLATEELLAFQDAWPHLDFPRILQLLREAFPSHFDHVSGAAAQNHGQYPHS